MLLRFLCQRTTPFDVTGWVQGVCFELVRFVRLFVYLGKGGAKETEAEDFVCVQVAFVASFFPFFCCCPPREQTREDSAAMTGQFSVCQMGGGQVRSSSFSTHVFGFIFGLPRKKKPPSFLVLSSLPFV